LKQLAHDEAENFSKAAPILLRDFYVDDCISETLEEALEIQSQLQDLLNSGGFTLRKWCSNSTELLATIPPKLQETQHAITDGDSDIVRTLGLIWRLSSEQFQITSGNTSYLIAEKELKNFLQDYNQKMELLNLTALLGLTWPFIPPAMPHFGGLSQLTSFN
jgi:translation initiation factor IF-1